MSADIAHWERRYEAIYRFVRRRTSREEAEDLTQETFAAAVKALGDARSTEDAPPLAWLYTVARRRLIDRLRREQHYSLVVESAIPASSVDERQYGPSIVRALLAGLRELDEQQRQVVVLKLFEGRPFAEIAEIVGVSDEACRARFSRGLAALRTHLSKEGVTP
jgi:RNA polymerase sigma factor (sigma-70 family)